LKSYGNGVAGLLVGYIYVETASQFVESIVSHLPQTRGVPSPLSQEEQAKFDKARNKMQRKINSERCRAFLVSVFGELVIAGIISTIDSQQTFSGPGSTNISVVEAGIYKPEDVERMRRLSQSSDPAEAARWTALMNQSISDYFRQRNKGSVKLGGVVGNFNGDPNTVFYKSIKAGSLLHETLHTLTGLDDNELAAALGVDITKFKGNSDLASDAINKRLKEMGCR
jgi:hypothetical protein